MGTNDSLRPMGQQYTVSFWLEQGGMFLFRLVVFVCCFALADQAGWTHGLTQANSWIGGLVVAIVGSATDWWVQRKTNSPDSWERKQVEKGLDWTPSNIHHRADYPSQRQDRNA